MKKNIPVTLFTLPGFPVLFLLLFSFGKLNAYKTSLSGIASLHQTTLCEKLHAEEETYNTAISENKKDADLYYKRANCRNKMGDVCNEKRVANSYYYEKAIDDYKKAIKLNPTRYGDTAYYKMGKAESRLISSSGVMGHYAAVKHFTKAIELNPNFTDAYYQRGVSRMNTDKYSGAIEDFTKTAELNPKLAAECYFQKGNCKLNNRDKKGACESWNKAKDLGYSVSSQLIDKFCK